MLGIGKYTQMQQSGVPQQPRGPAGPTVPPANRYAVCFLWSLSALFFF